MSSLTCKYVFYRPELNAKGWGPMALTFQDLQMEQTNGQSLKSKWEKWGHLSNYYVYSQSYDL